MQGNKESCQDASDRVDWRTRIGFMSKVLIVRARPNLGYSVDRLYCLCIDLD